MLAVLITALLLLAYILYTSPARNKPSNLYRAGDWSAPGNGYGRHGRRWSK